MRTGHAICCTDRSNPRSKASSFGLCLPYEESPKARNSSETGLQIECPKTVECFRSGRIVRLAMKRGPLRSSLEALSFSGLQLVLLNPRKRGWAQDAMADDRELERRYDEPGPLTA